METLEVGIVITSAHDSSTPYAAKSYCLIFLAVWISKGLSLIGIYMALFHHTTNYYKKPFSSKQSEYARDETQHEPLRM